MYLRKFYFLDRAASVGDPDTTYLTVPNIPFLTGMQKIRSMEGGFLKTTAGNVITKANSLNINGLECLRGNEQSR